MQIAVLSRNAAKAEELRGDFDARVLIGDFHDRSRVLQFCRGLSGPLSVLCLLPPGACQDAAGLLVPFEGLLKTLVLIAPTSAVLSSSTGVYGDHGNETVSAETHCRPVSAREHRLNELEARWQSLPGHRILRLAGLYGPGRVIGLQNLQNRQPIGGDPDGYLNLIHVEDAAALLLSCLQGAGAAIELGCDGAPVPRRLYYSYLAATFGLAAPHFNGEPSARGGGGRRCDPASSWRRLKWRPSYRDFRAGLAALPSAIIHE